MRARKIKTGRRYSFVQYLLSSAHCTFCGAHVAEHYKVGRRAVCGVCFDKYYEVEPERTVVEMKKYDMDRNWDYETQLRLREEAEHHEKVWGF